MVLQDPQKNVNTIPAIMENQEFLATVCMIKLIYFSL
jgi:hypothetical protein